MCKVHRQVGCLTAIKTHLQRHNISDFNSLNEVLNFHRSFSDIKEQIIKSHAQLIENEKITLQAEILQLENAVKTGKAYFENRFLAEIDELKQKLPDVSVSHGMNFVKRFMNYLKYLTYKRKIQNSELNFSDKVNYAVRDLINQYQEKVNRHNYITLHFNDAVNESCLVKIRELENKQRIIGEIENSIYGALGEHKVVKELENLSDENILINDFSLRFDPAIFNRQENDYIKSIQIDHLLIAPSGLFLIETKNWSQKSLASSELRSPVQQVKRTGFALFKVLNENISTGGVKLQHRWGERKIPIRNLIVLMNAKPKEQFQYVKVLTLNELLSYIKYFKPIFTSEETENIAACLLKLCK